MTVYIKVVVKLLRGLLGSLPFWGDWLQLGGTSPCRTLSLFLDVLGGCWGRDRLSVAGRFCESKSWVPSYGTEFGII